MTDIPNLLLPETLIIHKVPVLPYGTRYVYMELSKEQEKSNLKYIIVSIERFKIAWDKHNIDVSIPFACDKKLLAGLTDHLFSQSHTNPVELPEVAFIQDGIIRIKDGNTRIIWLIVHGAQAIPLACPEEYCSELYQIAGI